MNKGSGWGCVGVLLVVGAVVAALVSLAALVDPFDWVPSLKAIWKHCDGDCDLAHRYPGFWGHVVANLAYLTVGVALLAGLGAEVGALKETRQRLYVDPGARERLRGERWAVAG